MAQSPHAQRGVFFGDILRGEKGAGHGSGRGLHIRG